MRFPLDKNFSRTKAWITSVRFRAGIVAVRHRLVGLRGWKRDPKRLAVPVSVLIVLLGALSAGAFVARGGAIRLHVPVVFVATHTVTATGYTFRYPVTYADEVGDAKYGAAYLTGFHLPGDNRTGCDVRSSDTGLNFAKGDAAIRTALVSELSKSAGGFELKSAGRMTIGSDPAYSVEFSFTDPMGDTMRIDQVMTTDRGNHYILICGAHDAQWDFFKDDFQTFFGSFRFR